MENEITAHKAGKVAELPIAVGRVGGHRRHAGRDHRGVRVAPRRERAAARRSAAAHERHVRGVQRALRRRRAPGRQRAPPGRRPAPPGRPRPRPGSPAPAARVRRAVTGDDPLGLRRPAAAAAPASRGRPRPSRPVRASGSRPATDSRRTPAPWPTAASRRRRRPCGRRSGAARARGPRRPAELQPAGHRQRLQRAQRQRAAAVDVVLGVELAQLALGLRRARRPAARRSTRRAPSAAPGNASRPSRWSQSPWVASSPETGNPACSSTSGSARSSSG